MSIVQDYPSQAYKAISHLPPGARAEARLPKHFYDSAFRDFCKSAAEISYVGPQVPLHVQGQALEEYSKLTLKYETMMFQGEVARETDALVMFNSGIGHLEESKGWGDSLEKVLFAESSKHIPVLLTSFNEDDFQDDLRKVEVKRIKNLIFSLDLVKPEWLLP